MKINKKFCFVILNYNTFDYVCNCIKSIYKKCTANKFKIIIVDNHSEDDSLYKLNNKFKNDKNVEIISNNKNLGFSAGNNIGIKYANKNYSPDFIIVNNSDTILLTDNFLEKIEEIYEKEHFALLGPKINIINDQLQYIPYNMPTVRKLNKYKLIYYIKWFLNFIFLEVIDKRYFSNKNYVNKDNKAANLIYRNVIIHGCFLIFSKDYFKNYEGFPELTKLYREEEFIYLNCQSKNLLTLYNPDLEVFHCISGSMKNKYQKMRKRNMFIYKMQIKAINILKKELKNKKNIINLYKI